MKRYVLEEANKISEEIKKLQDELDRAEHILYRTRGARFKVKMKELLFDFYYGFDTTKEESREILELLINNRKQRIDELNKELDSL